jgi:hypothetical protein
LHNGKVVRKHACYADEPLPIKREVWRSVTYGGIASHFTHFSENILPYNDGVVIPCGASHDATNVISEACAHGGRTRVPDLSIG